MSFYIPPFPLGFQSKVCFASPFCFLPMQYYLLSFFCWQIGESVCDPVIIIRRSSWLFLNTHLIYRFFYDKKAATNVLSIVVYTSFSCLPDLSVLLILYGFSPNACFAILPCCCLKVRLTRGHILICPGFKFPEIIIRYNSELFKNTHFP